MAVQPYMGWIQIKKKKKGRHEVDFLHVDKQTFLQVDTINIGDSLAQSTQNNKFAKSLQYLEKKARDKVNFCRDKLQSIQSIYFGTVISDGCSQACLKYSK